MTTLNEAAALAAAERGLAVVSTVRADGTVQASLVNVGLLPHPVSGEPSLDSPPMARSNSATLGRAHNWPSRSATVGSGRPSKAEHNLSAPTIRGRGWSTASDCGCYSARSSLRRVARTTTGTSTTG